MPFALIILVFLLGGTAIPVWLHLRAHGSFNAHQAVLAFFLWLNVMINLWEICLLLRVGWIRKHYEGLAKDRSKSPLAHVKSLFFERVPFTKILSTYTWSKIWSTYSLFDESYSDNKSYGFWIDVGNEISTILPSVLFLYGMTFDLVGPRALGLIGTVLFWQMFYGTVLYFSQFLYHRRYRGHSVFDLSLFVGLTNGMWFVLPPWGIYTCVTLVYGDSFAIFR